MACYLDMYNNNDHQNGRLAPTMSPRISFSNDFVESHHENRTNTSSSRSELPSSSSSSSDFEFSVSNYNMMAADELFSKGRLLPYKANCGNSSNQFQPKMTLREELLHDEEEDKVVASSRPPKGPSRWKELLGLKRNNNIVKKSDKSDGVFGKKSMLSHESKSSQQTFTDEDDEGFGV